MENNQSSSSVVRVRFAPSPTGHLHIGGLRTALFNWLFAKHNNGVFLLRIEDTDLERSKDEYTQAIYQALAWVGIMTDEKPLIQSERFAIYKKIAHDLVQQEKAYWCSCTPEMVEARVRQAGCIGVYHGGYDGYCRNKNIGQQPGAAIRFLVANSTDLLQWSDAIRGPISFHKDEIDDFIIVRSDGTPTYNFCVVIDDHASKITHVIRGEDHISNTPKQIALYQSLGYSIPIFAHIPMILGPDGNKLSKRDGAVDVIAYRAMGYLPEALINYIVRLGWAHKDQEIFTISELIKYFSLEAVGKKPSVFDYTKLAWLNGVYMRAMPEEILFKLMQDQHIVAFDSVVQAHSQESIFHAIKLYKERSETIVQLTDCIVMLYQAPKAYSEQDVLLHTTAQTSELIAQVLSVLENHDFADVQNAIKAFCKDKGLKLAVIAQPIRIALTGSASSPGVFDLMAVLGKNEVFSRLYKFKKSL